MSDPGTDTATAIENRSESFAVDFLERVRATPDAEAYRFPAFLPDGREEWKSLTWAQAADRVKAIAAGLHALGARPADRVAIVAQTRVEWILADFGTACAGAATTTVYPSTNADEAAFILADSGSTLVFAEDDRQIEKLRAERERLGAVRKIITFDGTADDDWVVTLETLEADGRKTLAEDPGLVERLVAGITRDQLATLIYTSGTTGRPKGVRLTHDTWAYQAVAQQQMGLSDATDLQYLWLPLAHCYGKVMTVGQLRIGYTTAVDGRHTELVRNLPVVRPTFMAAAPRVFEKVYNAIHARVRRESPLRQRLFAWAVAVGRRHADATRGGRTASLPLTLRHRVADKLVLTTLREPFGGRMRGCISGSAALSDEVAGFFEAIGVPVLQGYGLTEASAGSTVNRYTANHLGTVGLPLPGTEIRIAEDDGEVLVRGPAVMAGYHNDADATAAVLDADGWLHTGDIGTIGAHGALSITDRKKDLIKTSNGKYVAPSDIEGRFKGLCPFAANIVVHGDGRTYCTALITLDADALRAWAAGSGGGLAALPYPELVATPQVKALIDGYVAKLNTGLQRWQTIKRFAILPRDLSVENGELTPSLKVKRAVVEREYADVLAGLYGDSPAT